MYIRWLLLVLTMAAAASWARSLTVQDTLEAETVGNAVFSPDGRYLAYERAYRYSDRQDFASVNRLIDRGSLRSDDVFIVDLASPGPARPLLERKPGVRRWLGGAFWSAGFSPDGKRLLVYEMEEGAITLLAVEPATGQKYQLKWTPDFSEGYESGRTPVWRFKQTVIYGGLPEDVQPSVPAIRRLVGQGYTKAWQRSWTGEKTSYTEWETNTPKPAINGAVLVMEDVESGESAVLARGRFESLHLSPDRRFLAAVGPTAVQDTIAPGSDKHCVATEQGMVLFTLDARRGYPVTCGGLVGWKDRANRVSWSPDSRSVAYFAWPSQAGPEQGAHYVFQLSTAQQRQFWRKGIVLESSGSTGTKPWPLEFMWDGSALLVSGRPAADPKQSGFGPLLISGTKVAERHWYRLHPALAAEDLSLKLPADAPVALIRNRLYSIQRGAVLRYEAGRWHSVRVNSRAGQFQALAFKAIGFPHQWVVDGQVAGRGALAVIEEHGRSVSVMSSAAPEGVLLVDRTATHAFSRDTEGGYWVAARKVDEISAWPADVQPLKCITITYTSRQGGISLQSSVTLPDEFNRQVTNRLVVVVYPSIPRRSCERRDESTQLLASYGLIVMEAATPGSIQRADAARPWDGLPGLVEDAAQAAINEGYGSPGKVGLYGFSQGAHAALWVGAKSALFKAIAVHNGHADSWQQYFNAGHANEFLIDALPPRVNENFERIYGDVGMGASALENPTVYLQNSAIQYAMTINAPVLLVNSDMDSFSRVQFDSLYAALARAGKTARLVTFWGEGHLLASPANIRAYYEQVAEWYRRHL